MDKIPTIFLRTYENEGRPPRLTDVPNPKCAFVFEGDFTARRMFDGTAVLVCDGRAYKRYTLKPGKPAPADFMPCALVEPDEPQPGWVPAFVHGHPALVDKTDKHLLEAWNHDGPLDDGTYELCGPKVNGNPEGMTRHALFSHAFAPIVGGEDLIRSARSNPTLFFAELGEFLRTYPHEGIVFYTAAGVPGGKIKRRDFGWPDWK